MGRNVRLDENDGPLCINADRQKKPGKLADFFFSTFGPAHSDGMQIDDAEYVIEVILPAAQCLVAPMYCRCVYLP